MTSGLLSPSIAGTTFSIHPTTNLPQTVLGPSDIETSIAVYENLLLTAKSYRNSLAALSQCANAFGAALEECSRTKGVDEAAEGLINVAGLQYLIANHQSVLSDTIYRSFEIPLRENLENFIENTQQQREEYKERVSKKKKELVKREKEHLALAHKKMRSLSKFREALADLTTLADDIDKLKSDYFYNALDHHSEIWKRVSARSNILLKAELSLYSGVAQKAEHLQWSLVDTPDPWTREPRSSDELFSIVPPQDILERPQSPGHDSLTSGLFQSLLGNMQDSTDPIVRTQKADRRQTSQEPSESSFFALHHDTKGLPAMKRSSVACEVSGRTSSQDEDGTMVNRDEEYTAAQTEDPASPYEDAEEYADQASITTRKSDVINAWHNNMRRIESSSFSTPSRPTSRRKNLQGDLTPRKQTGEGSEANIKNPLLTPKRPEPSDVKAVPADILDTKIGILSDVSSPENDGLKHSQYSIHTPSQQKIKAEEAPSQFETEVTREKV